MTAVYNDTDDGRPMWGSARRESLRLVAGLAGIVLLAALVAALPPPGHGVAAERLFADIVQRLSQFARLDLGRSELTGTPAALAVLQRLPVTLALVGGGALIALVLGAPFGLLAGGDRRIRPAAALVQVLAAMPVFCAGLLLLWLAYHGLGWHSARHGAALLWSGPSARAASPAVWLQALALPLVTVGLAGAAAVQLALRRAALALEAAPFRRHLRLLGLSGIEADLTYLWRPLTAALCAAAGDIVLALIAAAAVAEWVFGWPGVAVLFVKAVALGDWSVAALVLAILAALKLVLDMAGALAAAALSAADAR